MQCGRVNTFNKERYIYSALTVFIRPMHIAEHLLAKPVLVASLIQLAAALAAHHIIRPQFQQTYLCSASGPAAIRFTALRSDAERMLA